jgi:hypothetical protein
MRRNITICICILLTFHWTGQGAEVPNTDIAITPDVIRPSVQRFGINLGYTTSYDSGQMMKNLIFANPGFEGEIYQSTVRCADASDRTCTDQISASDWPDGFWDGATFEFFYGAANGRTGVVSAYQEGAPGQGGLFTFSDAGAKPERGDYMIVRKTLTGSIAAGWTPSLSGPGSVAAELTDLPPQTAGKQALRLVASDGGKASVITYFDSFQTRSFLRLNGPYELRFRAKGIGARKTSVRVVAQRLSKPNITYLASNVSLTGDWASYSLRYTASENGSEVGPLTLQFSTVDDEALLLDDVSLTEGNGDPANHTQFRDTVVNALKTLRPGVLRFWANQLGETLDNLLAPPFGRQRSGYSAWYRETSGVSYSLHEFLELCEAVGADPWFVVPITFSTTEASNLIEYLAGDASTPYGAKRAALGHPAKWTDSFHKIHLEFGNEAWNSILKGGAIEYPEPYGKRARTIFASMRGDPSFRASSFDLVLGGQGEWPGRNATIQNNCDNNDSFAVATYLMGTVNSYDSPESLFGPALAEPEAFVQRTGIAENVQGGGLLYQNEKAIRSSTHPVPLVVYETNLNTLHGTIPQYLLNEFVSSLGAGLAMADTMLLGLREFGIVNQNVFTLPQYQYKRPDGKTVFLWGVVVDMGKSDRKRPQYLALQLLNQAIGNGASMLHTAHTGADPTWDQALENTVQLKGAHYLQSFAFADGDARSAIVLNLSRDSSLPVTFSGADAPAGAVTTEQLTAARITDNNEYSQNVAIRESTIDNFDPAKPTALPPYSMTVFHWRHAASEGATGQ